MDEMPTIEADLHQPGMAKRHVLVALPETLMPALTAKMNEAGMDWRVIDDGEDTGVPMVATVLSSAAMTAGLARRGAQFKSMTMCFFASAAMLAASIVWHLGDGPFVVFAFMGAWFALDMLASHRRLVELRSLHARLKEQGF